MSKEIESHEAEVGEVEVREPEVREPEVGEAEVETTGERRHRGVASWAIRRPVGTIMLTSVVLVDRKSVV